MSSASSSLFPLYEPSKLGRWKIEYEERVIGYKVDQANEDHCGCCVSEWNKEDSIENPMEEEEEEEELLPYCTE